MGDLERLVCILQSTWHEITITEVGRTVAQFIYVLEKARKAHGDKVVLDNVTLNFLPGAKIGVVGPNGAGKSSLLRIMAGEDTVSNGEARLMPGFTVGMLAQEPPLNDAKTVLGNIEEAVAETKAKLERFNKIAEQMATDYSDELMEEMGKLQEELDHADAWDIDSQLELAMDALRGPPPDADVTQLSGGERRRVGVTGTLTQVLRVRAADTGTTVWICRDPGGNLYYQANRGGESAKWIEGETALFLRDVQQDGDTYTAIAHDGNKFSVNDRELTVVTKNRTETHDVEPE